MERLTGIWTPSVVTNNSPILLPERRDGAPFLMETEVALRKLGPAAQNLFDKLFDSPEFDRALDLIKNQRLGCRPDSANLGRLRSEAGGHIFSLLSHTLLWEEQQQQGIVVISPRDTEAIFEHLYSDRKKFNNRGWGLGIDGITVPDGILVKYITSTKAVIVGVCEHSFRYPGYHPLNVKQRAHYQNPDFVIEDFFPDGGRREFGVRLSEEIRRNFNFGGTLQVADRENFKVIYVYPRQKRQGIKEELQLSGSERFVPLMPYEFKEVMDGIFLDVENSLGLRLNNGV